ncbi:hypothetical protein MVES1_002345 [Malassezia vespertilionis]|uniref:Small ribosomal subunit protein mS38 n=1 Tax=Malassezia vespertilionis TaxID=2020962 RepID=A0A2N1JB68_9BASI|nr:uncharacterized protein MVES1_002345 [Malassezia vespertilionis]PKI83787.1 hypothetical protein MVES_002212 [Malassezia vespertilionis]WFD06990.1 hypothetical protein MVES1_002345 [Malassezia vespertilionis]
MAQARRTPLGLAAQFRAVPPPTSERSLHLQELFAQHRPLLEHHLLPARPLRAAGADMLWAGLDADAEAAAAHLGVWRHRVRGIDHATFATILDRLAPAKGAPRLERMRQARRTASPASPVVHSEFVRIKRQEQEEDAREEAIVNAMERGEDVTRAELLGAEAELVVLGEPHGSQKEWARGVATYLGTRTEPFVPPGASLSGMTYPVSEISGEVIELDPHLWLAHAEIQNSVKAAFDWDAVMQQVGAPRALQMPQSVQMDSVRRKRRKKMNKHKYKKLRKAQRAERQRLKK